MQYPDRSLESAESIAAKPAVAAAEQGIRDAVDKLEAALKCAVRHPEWVDKSSTLAWAMQMYDQQLR